jgi:uncharacterized protein
MNEPTQAPASGTAPTENERTWGMLAHLAALGGLVIPGGGLVIGLNALGPFLVSVAKGDQSAFVAAQAKEALNFNISVALAAIVCLVLWLVFIGILLGVALFITWLVMTLIAAIKASEGVAYRYPISLRLVK